MVGKIMKIKLKDFGIYRRTARYTAITALFYMGIKVSIVFMLIGIFTLLIEIGIIEKYLVEPEEKHETIQ